MVRSQMVQMKQPHTTVFIFAFLFVITCFIFIVYVCLALSLIFYFVPWFSSYHSIPLLPFCSFLQLKVQVIFFFCCWLCCSSTFFLICFLLRCLFLFSSCICLFFDAPNLLNLLRSLIDRSEIGRASCRERV